MDFQEFHETFVKILCRTYSTNPRSSDEDEEDSETAEDDDEEEEEGLEEICEFFNIETE